jgi:hypothetical protein
MLMLTSSEDARSDAIPGESEMCPYCGVLRVSTNGESEGSDGRTTTKREER